MVQKETAPDSMCLPTPRLPTRYNARESEFQSEVLVKAK